MKTIIKWCLLSRYILCIAVCFVLVTSLLADDEPYLDYVMRRVSEGLACRESPSLAERFEGAYIVALYVNNLKEENAPEEFIAESSHSIRDWLRSEEEPWIRHSLIEALGEADSESNRAWIAGFLVDQDPTLRARAAEYIHASLTEELERAILDRYVKEDLWWVKAAFIESLGSGDSEESLEVIHEALDDPSRDVRAAATSALGQRANPRSVQPLIKALERGDLIGTDSPVWALGRIGDRRAVVALEAAATVPHPIVRLGVAWALGQTAEPASESVIVRLVSDPDAMVRAEAIEALGELGGVGAALELLSVLEEEPSDRTFYALVRVAKADLSRACNQFLSEGGVERTILESRADLCEKAEQLAGGDEVWFWSSGEMHSTFYSATNAKAREVHPAKGRKAVTWEEAIGKELGGTRHKLHRGTRLTIWRAALYEGETWLEVAMGPYGGNLWIRESDVRPIHPEHLREESIWTNYGGDTRMVGTVGRE